MKYVLMFTNRPDLDAAVQEVLQADVLGEPERAARGESHGHQRRPPLSDAVRAVITIQVA